MNKNLKDCDQDFDTKFVYAKIQLVGCEILLLIIVD